MQEQIGNFRHVSETAYYPSWKKGDERRQQILKLLQDNPQLSIEAIAQAIALSPTQVKRHRARLISDCLWKVCGLAIILSTTFTAGAYYADSAAVEEAIAELFNLAIEKAENIGWAIEQKTL
ncbi:MULTISPECIES: Lrp/AsnC family transcriptional regulator [unclassified Microcoleus]|uniref:Lrp/AsnC family transcriptional regulator n=1 Tax=unclassified Microcoleus TaxID=2642155 RepID=UPI002FCEE59B